MKITNFKSILGTVSLAVLCACGSQATHETTTTSSVTGTQTSTSSTSGTGNIYNLPLASANTAQINGALGAIPSQTFTVATSHTLKVKVTPMSAPNLRLSGYENYVFPYGCLKLTVTVNGVAQETSILRVDGVSQGATSVCASASTYQVLDFTNAVSGGSTVNVTVSNANYDNCRYTWPLNYGCQMSALFQSHEAKAGIQIQTDGTWLDL